MAQDGGEAQGKELFGQQFVTQIQLGLAQFPALAQDQLAQSMQLVLCEAGCVDMVQQVSTVAGCSSAGISLVLLHPWRSEAKTALISANAN